MLKNILWVFLGLAVGSFVNMGIITIGPNFVPPPAGVDVTNLESMQAGAHLFEAKHFLFPWLAHAAGTFVGALVAALLAQTCRKQLALWVAVIFLVGGLMMVFSFPSPTWFMAADIGLAYIPMALLSHKLAERIKG